MNQIERRTYTTEQKFAIINSPKFSTLGYAMDHALENNISLPVLQEPKLGIFTVPAGEDEYLTLTEQLGYRVA